MDGVGVPHQGKRVCKSLQNTEAEGAITVEDAKASVQRLQEETLGANAESVGA